jgi:hypothetical protein
MATVPRSVCAAALGAQTSRRATIDRQQNNAFRTHRSFFPDAAFSVVWLDCGIAVSAVTAASILESSIGSFLFFKSFNSADLVLGKGVFLPLEDRRMCAPAVPQPAIECHSRHTIVTLTTAKQKVCR